MKVKAWSTENIKISEKIIDGTPIKVFDDRPRSLGEVLSTTAARYPDNEAIVYLNERLTYRVFAQRVDTVSAALQDLCNIRKGDRVALLFTNTLEFCICFFAVTRIGAICQPMNYRLTGDEMKYQLNDTEAKVLIMEEIYLDVIQKVLPGLDHMKDVFVTGSEVPDGFRSYGELERHSNAAPGKIAVDEEDIASIVYTSGTTGRPKGAIICHRNLICNSISFSCIAQVTSRTKQMVLTPLFHASALHSQLITSVLQGGTCVIMKEFKTKESLALMASEKINLVVAVPTMYWFWINDPDLKKFDLTSIECALSGAAPAAPELIKRISEEFPLARFINAGGQTESTSCTFALPPEDALAKAGSIGWATPPNEIMVVNWDGKECELDETGELWFRGPAVCKGYWKNPQATRDTFTDGWVHTGDVGKVDADGYLYLLDRMKDMIIRGGENIYCIEVENVLCSHPKVLEAAVVGVPDKIYGEQVKAALVLKPGEKVDDADIREFCSKHLADYKVPKFIQVIDMLPRNAGGKVIKARLRETD